MNDYDYMLIALKEARKAYYKDEVPVGAVIVQNNKIVGKAYNKKEQNKCALLHAEIIAIEKACKKIDNWRLLNSTIYVTLEPCPMCASAIKQSRIKKIVYLFENNNRDTGKIVDNILNSKDSNQSVEKVKLDISEFSVSDQTLISLFFQKKRH